MGMLEKKLIQEVETRWNRTFAMLQRLHKEREPFGAALASLSSDLIPFGVKENETDEQCLMVLGHFTKPLQNYQKEKGCLVQRPYLS